MMARKRDETHREFIERWADYVYETRKSREWKKQHSRFINSQIKKANDSLLRIAKVKGVEVVAEIRGIKNPILLEKYKNLK